MGNNETQQLDAKNVPSDIFTFEGDSMLVRGVYLQHGAASGHDLCIDDVTWLDKASLEPVRYSYHQQGRAEDYWANQWLQHAFARWVQFMNATFAVEEKAG